MGLSLRRGISLAAMMAFGGTAQLTGAATLLDGETEGFALDFTDDTAVVRDTGTPANDYTGEASLGLLTYTSPSVKMVTGSDGTLKFANHNRITYSQDFSNAAWTKTTGGSATTPTITANYAAAPDGTMTAARLQATTSGTASGDFSIVQQLLSLTSGGTGSVYIKSNTGSNQSVYFRYDITNNSNTVTATNEWQRFDFSTTNSGSYITIGCRGTANGATTVDILVWGAQVKRTPVHDAGTLADYIPTTSAAVYRLPIEYDSAGNVIGVPNEEQRTSLGLYSSDLTNAAWTKSNMTAALTATGPDGVANSATTLTATAGNATVLQAITSASAARITSTYIKRRTGTGNIDLTQDNGSTWTTVTVTSSWTRVQIPSVTSSNPTIGLRIVTSGDAVDVAHFQHELGAFITTPIPTTSAQVTRAADQVSIATSAIPYDASAGTLVAAFRPYNVGAARRILQIDDGTANERVTLSTNSTPNALWTVIDGGVSQAAIATGTPVAATNHKAAARWASNDFALCFDGGAVSTDVSGTLPTMTTLRLGAGVSSAEPLNGWLRQVTYLPAAKNNATLQTRTAA